MTSIGRTDTDTVEKHTSSCQCLGLLVCCGAADFARQGDGIDRRRLELVIVVNLATQISCQLAKAGAPPPPGWQL
jgi:hypothetical protein